MAKADTQQVEMPGAEPEDRPEDAAGTTVMAPRRFAMNPEQSLAPVRAAELLARWLRRDARFLLAALACSLVSVLLLSAGGGALRTRTSDQATHPQATRSAPTAAAIPTLTRLTADVVPARERTFDMPTVGAGLMQPTVDAHGDIWFGEMGANKLASLDPRTGIVREWQPPNAQHNIMETAVDPEGNIWFTEQVANYIGRFAPGSQQFTTYPLEKINGHSSAPQDLAIDAGGKVWFTEISGGKIGKLDPDTAKITTWPVPSPDKGPAYPFSLALTGEGRVWFGYLSGGALGALDPLTGAVKIYRLRDPQAQVFGVAADAKGRVWFTELEQGAIGWVETASGRVTELVVPQTLGTNVGLYGVVVAQDGSAWFASSGENALLRYDADAARLTFYQLGRTGSAPFGLALGGDGTLWFTADSNPNNYVGAVRP